MTMESVGMGRMYPFGRPDKMSVQIPTPPSPPEMKYDNDISLGPYYAHYWSLVGGTVEHAGIPLPGNGGYISPYGAAPEPFFTAIQDPELPIPEEVQWEGMNGCENGLFTHSRSTTYAPVHETSPYTPTLDGSPWYPSTDPVLQVQSLPVLDSLANQILTTLASGNAQDFATTVSSPDTGKGQAYAALEGLFEQQKRIFSRDRLFLDPNLLQFSAGSAPRVVRKANLATFVNCIFRGQDIPFLELDEAFLEIFMPIGSRLLKQEAALYLELKTQAFIAIMMGGGAKKEDVLDRLFPRDLQLAILRRRPEPTHLAPSEHDFISRTNTRRQYLSSDSNSIESLSQLPQKYIWKDFLEEATNCVRRVLETIESIKNGHALVSSSMAQDDAITKATLAAHAAISGHKRTLSNGSVLTSPASASSATFHHSHIISFADSPTSVSSGRSFGKAPRQAASSASPTTPTTPSSLHMAYPRTTSHPSQHKTAMSGPPRRPNAPSPRRPWTSEEEKALLDGLERVKGPHWSQILALYGAGGSISEVLKDRNQVQLKDKARNLKLFFLKSGVEVPGYLKKVTGELRTRAPGQAARRERERRREEEERARRDRESGKAGV